MFDLIMLGLLGGAGAAALAYIRLCVRLSGENHHSARNAA